MLIRYYYYYLNPIKKIIIQEQEYAVIAAIDYPEELNCLLANRC